MQTPNLFSLYAEYVKDTESPMIFHRWCIISALATLLERNCWIPFGTSRIFPNMYIMLVGHPGSRKSSAIKGVRRVIASTGYNKFSAERTTKEKFLLDLMGDVGAESEQLITDLFGGSGQLVDPRAVYITSDEFNEFAGNGNIEFLSMLGALWDWDDPESPYKQRLKSAKSATIYQPTINILAGNTHTSLAAAFPSEIIGQGFMSRLILIHSDPSGRKITIPPVPSPEILSQITRELVTIQQEVKGEIRLTKEAHKAIDDIYHTWPELQDQRFKHYSTRRLTHLLKLCIVCMAVNKVTEITMKDVLLANTILTYAESHMSKALGEIGRKKGSDISSSVISVIYEAKGAITISQLWEMFSHDLGELNELQKIVKNLHTANKIQVVKIPGGREEGFLPKQKRMVPEQHLYVDWKLLKGVEMK